MKRYALWWEKEKEFVWFNEDYDAPQGSANRMELFLTKKEAKEFAKSFDIRKTKIIEVRIGGGAK